VVSFGCGSSASADVPPFLFRQSLRRKEIGVFWAEL
jgi:hypothetical protein